MGQIRKINDVYYIEFYARGLLYSQVAGGNLQVAQNLLRQVEKKIAGGEALTISRHIELVDFFERFLTQAKKQHAQRSVKRFAASIDHFSRFLSTDFPRICQLAQLTPAVIETYKIYLVKTQKVKIVNLTILIIRDILEYGINLGFLTDNPALHLRLLPWPRTVKRRLTARHELARRLLSQGTGLGKFSQLMKLTDIARALYFSNLIPLGREDVYH